MNKEFEFSHKEDTTATVNLPLTSQPLPPHYSMFLSSPGQFTAKVDAELKKRGVAAAVAAEEDGMEMDRQSPFMKEHYEHLVAAVEVEDEEEVDEFPKDPTTTILLDLPLEGIPSGIACDVCRVKFPPPQGEGSLQDPFRCAGCCQTFGSPGVSPPKNRERERSSPFRTMLSERHFSQDTFPRLLGREFGISYILRTGMRLPVMILRKKGLGLQILQEEAEEEVLSVEKVVQLLGGYTRVPVIDVERQQEEAENNWNLFKYQYYYDHPELRQRPVNVISLEVTGSDLGDLITRPRTVQQIDWSDLVWPKEEAFPKVQLYVLMSVADCWTNFHIDFGGTSVFYHLLYGQKVFYLIEPTPENLAIYEGWSTSTLQDTAFLGDLVETCTRVEINPGNTVIIPTGWIHAVFTPVDSLVVGGNFLHSFNIPMQLQVAALEDRAKIPNRFRFPYYDEMQWHAAAYFLQQLEAGSKLSSWESAGLLPLVEHLRPLVDDNSRCKGTKEQLVLLQKLEFLAQQFLQQRQGQEKQRRQQQRKQQQKLHQ